MNGDGSSVMDVDSVPPDADDPINNTICIPSCDNQSIIHSTHPDFQRMMDKHYIADELRARHRISILKLRLHMLQGEEFWKALMTGMTDITGSQYTFVAKRILKGDAKSAVEYPPLGEEGSCLMGLAYYVRSHDGSDHLFKDIQYKGYKCPCAHMKHDRVLVIPDGLPTLFPDNPNSQSLPIPAEAYLAIPLFTDGKCYGHVGMMWSKQGLDARPGLSWAFLEIFLKSLEDLLTWRILEKPGNPSDSSSKPWHPFMGNVVLHEDVSQQQTIRPAARNLSHELRTPLQGVVGMLDVMLASLDNLEVEPSPEALSNFAHDMRKNIENCQDSAQRVVDAADNMVHALDLNSDMALESPAASRSYPVHSTLMSRLNATSRPTLNGQNPRKRKRNDGNDDAGPPTPQPPGRSKTPPIQGSGNKYRRLRGARGGRANSLPPDDCLKREIDTSLNRPGSVLPLPPTGATPFGTHTIHQEASGQVTLNHRKLNLIEFISGMLQVALKSGGRPDQVQVSPNQYGEIVTATRRSRTLKIDWSVEFVPPMLIIDKLTLEKTLYAVLHNAVKFTSSGDVKLVATVTPDSKFVQFTVTDTGPGIKPEFVPHVFEMWRRQDNSLTRTCDGVGLGLFVAKRLAIRLGGDISLVNTVAEGDKTGSEFHIILPIEMRKDTKYGRSDSPAIAPRKPVDRNPALQPLPSPEFPRPSSSSTAATSPVLAHARNIPQPQQPQLQLQQLPPPAPAQSPSQQRDQQLPPNEDVSVPYRPRKQSVTLRQPVNGTNGDSRRRSMGKKNRFDRELGKKLPINILVVEDNDINRNLITKMLRTLGFAQNNIIEAHDGEDAVEVMKVAHNTNPIELILMDLWMPGMNGIEATEKIFALPQYSTRERRLTVLAVSADASPEAHRDITRVGMQGFLKKPHTIEGLEQLIVEHFRHEFRHPSMSS
ncbi:hypothetical protein DRE_06614 [Drechslerella stenobrocha 248]|uniref:histidine kinase n=1 Tax=Drechslerella stenobrocha 248 TaxID=1043628 RepID=W7I6V4_9PEZI|nr:hypothetical protein DRE_06614 [Drechslerella stenobrocha 248]